METNLLSHSTPEERLLAGRRVAFTGRLAAMSRREAFLLVRRTGGEPVPGVSRRTDILVVGARGWPILPDGTISLKLQQAEKFEAAGLMVEIVSERTFLEHLGILPPLPSDPAACTLERACRLLGLPAETVRRCQQFGLIRPRDGGLAFQDLLSLRRISNLLQEGMTPSAVAGALAKLARFLPEFDHPLSQVRLIAQEGGLVTELHGAKIDEGGQLLLDFAPEARRAAPSICLEHPPRAAEAERWLEAGLERENEGNPEEASIAYRRALDFHPAFAQAHYNLANILLRRDDLEGAEGHYREAVRHAPDLACAWYNFGHVLAELSRLEEAVEALLKAAAILPSWPDPRFNLAICLEELGRRSEAATHWRAYLRLDPSGEWAEMAKTHLRRGGLLVMKAPKPKGG